MVGLAAGAVTGRFAKHRIESGIGEEPHGRLEREGAAPSPGRGDDVIERVRLDQ